MGNDMFNDEQLVFLELRQKETEEGLSWWKGRALKAEAERDALRARLDAPPSDAAREAVRGSLTGVATLADVVNLREIAESLHARGQSNRPNYLLALACRIEARLLSTPAPAPSAKETHNE